MGSWLYRGILRDRRIGETDCGDSVFWLGASGEVMAKVRGLLGGLYVVVGDRFICLKLVVGCQVGDVCGRPLAKGGAGF